MLTKSQRLKNLKQARHDLGGRLAQLLAEHRLYPAGFTQITGWSPLYLQAIINGRANLSISDINYLASLFDRRLKIEFVE